MQPGSQRKSRELNTIIDDPSGERCLSMGWLDNQHNDLGCVCVYGLPTVSDAFANDRWSLVSGDVEESP